MRFIEIDGKTCNVNTCWDCPCYDVGCDMCQHPKYPTHGNRYSRWYAWDNDRTFKKECPLREVAE